MLTEESFITIEQLINRWPGKPCNEIGDNISSLFAKEEPLEDPFMILFPVPFVRRGVERLNPKTGNIVWDVKPLESPLFRSYDYGYDFEGICFRRLK